MKKRIMTMALLVALLCFGSCYAKDAASAFLPPQNLRVPALAADDNSIMLVWEKPAEYDKIANYNIYMDGKKLGKANDNLGTMAEAYVDGFYNDSTNSKAQKISRHNYLVKGLKPNTTYTFVVKAVDAKGHESPASNCVTQATASVAKIFNVVNYGAIGDGATVNTKAIQAAIDACTPGGKVLIPAGVFKSGSIWLKGDMTLEIAKGGTLLGSENPNDYEYHYLLYDYSTDERYYALINAQRSTDKGIINNIRIVGEGIIDGNGWQKVGVDQVHTELPVYAAANNTANKDGSLNSNHVLRIGILAKTQIEKLMSQGMAFKATYPRRSNLITLRGVNNVYYGNFTAVNPANHTVVNINCNDVTFNNVKFKTYECNNGDGIEFIHSDGLIVVNSFFDTGDDCINFAAGMGAAGEKNKFTGNAWIFNNYFNHGHGAVVAGSHTAAWIENILAEDNVIVHTDIGLRAKTAPPIGGGARKIIFRDNALKDIEKQAFIFTSGYSDPNAVIEYAPAKVPGQFRDIIIKNCTVDKTGAAAIEVTGIENGLHQNLHFENITFYNAKPAKISYLKDSSFKKITFAGYKGNPWIVTNSSELSFDSVYQ